MCEDWAEREEQAHPGTQALRAKGSDDVHWLAAREETSTEVFLDLWPPKSWIMHM